MFVPSSANSYNNGEDVYTQESVSPQVILAITIILCKHLNAWDGCRPGSVELMYRRCDAVLFITLVISFCFFSPLYNACFPSEAGYRARNSTSAPPRVPHRAVWLRKLRLRFGTHTPAGPPTDDHQVSQASTLEVDQRDRIPDDKVETVRSDVSFVTIPQTREHREMLGDMEMAVFPPPKAVTRQ